MVEKRDSARKKKRLKVRFGVDYPKRIGFTDDISGKGIFVLTGQPERPGSKLLLEICLPSEELVIVYGVVQWAKRVPANLVRVASKGGMGVRFLRFERGERELQALIAELRR